MREEADLEDADTLAVANSMDHAAAAPAAARAVSFADSEEERPGAQCHLGRVQCRRYCITEASRLRGWGGGGARGAPEAQQPRHRGSPSPVASVLGRLQKSLQGERPGRGGARRVA